MSHLTIIKLIGVDTLSSELGQKVDTVRKWRHRKRIPPDHWVAVAELAKRRNLGVSLEALAKKG